jgi:hypothetical protein
MQLTDRTTVAKVPLTGLSSDTLVPMQLAKAVHAAEAKQSLSTRQKRGDFLQGIFDQISQPR